MQENKQKYLFDMFETYFPSLARQTGYCYVSGKYEITAVLKNGDTCIYDDYDNSIRFVKNRETIDEETWRTRFGQKLYRMLRDQHITSKELSESTNISEITLSKYINGKATPSTYNLQKIATALSCSEGYLMDHNERISKFD